MKRLWRAAGAAALAVLLAACSAPQEDANTLTVAATAVPGAGCTVRVAWPVAALPAEAAQEPGAL